LTAEAEAKIGDFSMIHITEYVPVHGSTNLEPIVRRLRVKDFNAWHENAVRSLKACLERYPTTPVVVLTHHAPLCHGTSDPRYEVPERTINKTFASDQLALMGHPIKLWAFGHTHWRTDLQIRSTRVYSNPYGYTARNEACQSVYRSDEPVIVEW
jgi:hypothetical protein